MAAKNAWLQIATEVPKPHGAVSPCRCQLFPIRPERHAVNTPLMTLQGAHLPASEVPDAHGMVLTAGGQPRAVAAESHTLDPIPVGSEGAPQLAAGRVPQPDLTVRTG